MEASFLSELQWNLEFFWNSFFYSFDYNFNEFV